MGAHFAEGLDPAEEIDVSISTESDGEGQTEATGPAS
jgi:hypothetical protein